MSKETHSQSQDFKDAIKLIRKIAGEDFRRMRNEADEKYDTEDSLIAIENACLDFLEDKGI